MGGVGADQLRSLRAGRPVDGSVLLEPLDMLLPEPLEVDGLVVEPLDEPLVAESLVDGLVVEPLDDPLVVESLVDGLVVDPLDEPVDPVEPEVLESVLGLVVLPEVEPLDDPVPPVFGGVEPAGGVVMPPDDEPLGDVLLDELEPVGPVPVVLLLLPVLSDGLDAPVEPAVGDVDVWA